MNLELSYKNAFLFFGIGFFFALFLCFMWSHMAMPETPSIANTISPKTLEKTIIKSEKLAAVKMDSLNTKNEKLKTELKETEAILETSKQKTASLQTQIFDLLDRRFEEQQNHPFPKDSLCDSLAAAYLLLLSASEQKDSIYEDVTANLESQLTNKDSAIVIHQREYAELKSAFTSGISHQKELASQNAFLAKTVRKQKLKSGLLSAAMFLISGAAASYIIHH